MKDEELEALVERVLEEPPGSRRDGLLELVDDRTQRAYVEDLVKVGDLVWEAHHGAPALDDDPGNDAWSHPGRSLPAESGGL